MASFIYQRNDIQEWIAGIYLRVSTFDQAREGHSYEEQEKDLRKLCERRGFKIHAVYGDPGVSGRKYEKRKDFQNLLDDIRTGRINVIVVWRLDRLVRGVSNTQKVIEEAKKYGCRIITSYNDVDYNTAAGKYQINMEAAHGEYELDVISERTKLGMVGALEKGHFPKFPFGYMRDTHGADPKKVIVNPDDAKFVIRMFELYLQGNSFLTVCNQMNEEYPGKKKFTRSALEKMFHNECYIGKYHCKTLEAETGEECVYPIPRIIPQEMWDEMQEQYRKNQLHNKRKQTYIFMQKIKCPHCNHEVLAGTLGRGRHGGEYCYYMCTRCNGVGYIPEPNIEKAFIREIDTLLDYYLIADVGTVTISNDVLITDDTQKYKDMLNDMTKRESRVKMAYFDGYMKADEFKSEMNFIQMKIKSIKKEMNKGVNKNVRITDDMDITMYSTIKEIQKRQSSNYFSSSEDIWCRLSKEEKRLIVADFIEDMEIKVDKKKNVTITNIKFRESKVFNLVYMMREKLMDMVIEKDNRNILVSSPQTKYEIDDFIKKLEKKYDIKTLEVSIDDIEFESMDANKVVKIMPIKNTSTYNKQKFRIITI